MIQCHYNPYMPFQFKRNTFFFVIFLIIIALIILLYFFSPRVIIEKIGVRNVYIIVFLTAFLAGASSLSSTSYFVFLASLAAGGLNPFILGLLGGAGLTLSDPLFFYFGMQGRAVVSHHKKLRKIIVRLTSWIKGQPEWVIPFFIFVYSGLTPFPSDILSASLALVNYPFRKFLFFIFLGNVNFAIIVSLISPSLINSL